MALHEKLQQDDGASDRDGKAYISLFGYLIYVIYIYRTDIVHLVSIVSRFMSNPSKLHYVVTKRILSSKLIGFPDKDWARSPNDRNSTLTYVVVFRSKVISWSSRK